MTSLYGWGEAGGEEPPQPREGKGGGWELDWLLGIIYKEGGSQGTAIRGRGALFSKATNEDCCRLLPVKRGTNNCLRQKGRGDVVQVKFHGLPGRGTSGGSVRNLVKPKHGTVDK